MPRNLQILRINDRLPAYEVADPAVPRQYVPEGPLDLLEVGGHGGISSLLGATRFWKEYRAERPADLIVADVHFDFDTTSPLSRLLHEHGNHTSMGLSFVKPFLAGAHSGQRLQAVGIHTADASLWATLSLSEQPLDRCMSLLAAHQIAEVAAIYDGSSLVEESMRQKSLRPYWDWLERNARAKFDGAVRLSLRRYRKLLLAQAAPAVEGGLPGVFVAPGDYQEVLNWCEAMRQEPRELCPENDCGLTFFYPDGSTDCVYIASLFAEVDDISWRALPASCFDTAAEEDADVDPAELDASKLPRIGRFLQRLGDLSAACHEATEILERNFPITPSDLRNVATRLTQVEVSKGPPHLVRGLAAVFQLIRLHEYEFAVWEDKFSDHVWEPREGVFAEVCNPALSLEAAASGLLELIRGLYADGRRSRRTPFYRDEVFLRGARDARTGRAELRPVKWLRGFTTEEMNSDWVRFVFGLLVADGILRPAPDDGYFMVSKRRRVRTPPIPSATEFPGGRSAAEVLGLPEKTPWLRESLGFDAGDANSLERILAYAFVRREENVSPSKQDKVLPAKQGHEFRKRLEGGQGPPWLLKICREYAAEVLHCENRDALPHWLYPNA